MSSIPAHLHLPLATVVEKLSRNFRTSIDLSPGAGRGGRDPIFVARAESGRGKVVAYARVFDPQRRVVTPPELESRRAGRGLRSVSRLHHEAGVYRTLGGRGISAELLWADDSAVVCLAIQGKRVSRILSKRRGEVWRLGAQAFGLTRRMHRAGVVHLDLNLGNFICDEVGKLRVIDFESVPHAGVSDAECRVFDLLALLSDLSRPRRGGRRLARRPERVERWLSRAITDETMRTTGLQFCVRTCFPSLVANRRLFAAAQSIFAGLAAK